MKPRIPNDMSTHCQNQGMPRSLPNVRAKGGTAAQAIMPKSTTQTLRTGSRNAPTKARAMTRWANASQSVP
jgi:hypothetical protein